METHPSEEGMMSKCDCLRCHLESRVALLERDKCQQRNCTRAVGLAHLIRRAATIAEDNDNPELAMFLRLGLAFEMREDTLCKS